jgi:hypothetical protein
LIVHCAGLATGGGLTPYRQSSANGVQWGDLARGAMMTATGIRVIAQAGGIGIWARARWGIASGAPALPALRMWGLRPGW